MLPELIQRLIVRWSQLVQCNDSSFHILGHFMFCVFPAARVK